MDGKRLTIKNLGEARYPSPMATLRENTELAAQFRDAHEGVLFDNSYQRVIHRGGNLDNLPKFEAAGPRSKLFFEPSSVRAGIVTCGGLCPGLNDVIRGLVMILWYRYGVRQIEGYRYGYRGLNPSLGHSPMELRPEVVSRIHQWGGTILGSSRGPQDPATVVQYLQARGVDMLFVIGGDGTLRGGHAIHEEAVAQGYPLAVVGIPKTIDNDIQFVDPSFGFQTAVAQAVKALQAAHVEAMGAMRGVGLVKLMGRHSGFIACHAALASNDANFVLIPEVDFDLEGPHGLLEQLRHRLIKRDHAVIVVAEGAGQKYVLKEGKDASGNPQLGDIGIWLRDRIAASFDQYKLNGSIKYIDPSYLVRGVPANPPDGVYCFQLAQHAVHAAMAGRTDMVVGRWHGQFVHMPIELAIEKRQVVDPAGDLWLSVLEATGQPDWKPAPNPEAGVVEAPLP